MKTYMTLQAKEDQERDEYRARAEAAEAEVAVLQDRIKELAAALGLASAFVAKANADGAYSNTTMTGERALAIISDALGYDNDGAYVRRWEELTGETWRWNEDE